MTDYFVNFHYICTSLILKHMETLVKKINELCAAFAAESEKNVCGNKAAGMRARKISLELEKNLKEFRKVSVEATK